ncbi:DmsE family decaheme c-type cytochrome [Desulfobulbus sp.]|uniref:DmsE family decaheme c-type cytochrome n=1 Tax=Desulfobulbus sp. TaxID=895 RepID=UPI00286EED29|nr:DmsE family decaheme c-type cytochrome [Desulfobulbus sp.]
MKKTCFAVLLLPLGLLLLGSSPSTGDATDATEAADAKKGFIGAITCKDCHETQYESYARSVHFQKYVKGPQSQDACETCHGPGASHVEKGGGRGVDIFAFEKQAGHTAEEISGVCLKCHATTARMTYWDMGQHKKNDVACTACHAIHKQQRAPVDQLTVCFRCHRDIKAQISKQSRHPILEGKVKCSDCHDVHGAMSKGMIKAETPNLLCYTCHADKRGPFVWVHPPADENCLICHTPHGSRHENLFADRIHVICQDCHDDSSHHGAAYDNRSGFGGAKESNRFVARACVECHHSMHGSANFRRSFSR